jgi:hypothetical protein
LDGDLCNRRSSTRGVFFGLQFSQQWEGARRLQMGRTASCQAPLIRLMARWLNGTKITAKLQPDHSQTTARLQPDHSQTTVQPDSWGFLARDRHSRVQPKLPMICLRRWRGWTWDELKISLPRRPTATNCIRTNKGASHAIGRRPVLARPRFMEPLEPGTRSCGNSNLLSLGPHCARSQPVPGRRCESPSPARQDRVITSLTSKSPAFPSPRHQEKEITNRSIPPPARIDCQPNRRLRKSRKFSFPHLAQPAQPAGVSWPIRARLRQMLLGRACSCWHSWTSPAKGDPRSPGSMVLLAAYTTLPSHALVNSRARDA